MPTTLEDNVPFDIGNAWQRRYNSFCGFADIGATWDVCYRSLTITQIGSGNIGRPWATGYRDENPYFYTWCEDRAAWPTNLSK